MLDHFVLLRPELPDHQYDQQEQEDDSQADEKLTPRNPHRALLDQYCVGCHNQRTKTANLMFDAMDLAQIPKDAEIWEKAIRKLRGGLMPPPGSRQPERAAVESLKCSSRSRPRRE